MKVSINRANKLRVTLEGISFSFDTSVQLRTDGDASAMNALYTEAQAKVVNDFEASLTIVGHIKTIREIINTANNAHGITALIAEIAHKERLIKHCAQALGSIRGGSRMEDFIAAVNYRQTIMTADVTKAPAGQGVNVSVGSDLKVLVEKTVKTLKLELQELQEKRSNLNHSNFVELPTDLVEFLKANSLVA